MKILLGGRKEDIVQETDTGESEVPLQVLEGTSTVQMGQAQLALYNGGYGFLEKADGGGAGDKNKLADG